jgi:hypothetical protein
MSGIYWYKGKPVAVAAEGRKYLRCLSQEADGLRVIRVPRGTPMPPVLYRGREYPTARASRHFAKLSRLPGTSKTARVLLRRWREEG